MQNKTPCWFWLQAMDIATFRQFRTNIIVGSKVPGKLLLIIQQVVLELKHFGVMFQEMNFVQSRLSLLTRKRN